jgi:hypothetical protein
LPHGQLCEFKFTGGGGTADQDKRPIRLNGQRWIVPLGALECLADNWIGEKPG